MEHDSAADLLRELIHRKAQPTDDGECRLMDKRRPTYFGMVDSALGNVAVVGELSI